MSKSAASAATVAVVGAGLSGLVAAKRLADSGRSVVVIDKGRSVGGRLATRRIHDATLDHGAQFFTVRSAEFAAFVDVGEPLGIDPMRGDQFGRLARKGIGFVCVVRPLCFVEQFPHSIAGHSWSPPPSRRAAWPSPLHPRVPINTRAHPAPGDHRLRKAMS